MNIFHEEINQRICDDIIQLQLDLDGILKQIFDQAGNKIKPEQQAEVEQNIAGIRNLLECLKNSYS
jgi:hypothetical protein